MQTTSSDGTMIVFDRTGSGPPVVLLGGGPATRSAEAPLAALLAAELTVYTYDRRGRGESGDTQPHSVDREFEDLAAVIAEAGEPVGLYGSSGAAMIGLAAAVRGLPISRLALWEPPYIVGDSRPPVPADWGERVSSLLDTPGDAIEYWLVNVVGVPAEFVVPMKATPFWAAMAANAKGLVYDAKVLGDFTMPAGLASVAVPTLVMEGGSMPFISSSVGALLDVLPNARRRALDGQPHDVAAAAIAPVLAEFFAG